MWIAFRTISRLWSDQTVTSLAVVISKMLTLFLLHSWLRCSIQRGGRLMFHAAVSISVGIWEGTGPAHGSESDMDPPFHTRALGEMLARASLGPVARAWLRECLDFHLVAIASGSATLSCWGTFQTKSLSKYRAQDLSNCFIEGQANSDCYQKSLTSLSAISGRKKMLISQQVSFCIRCLFISIHKSMR